MNVQPRQRVRGAKLLLVHCSRVDERRPSAAVRLEQKLGCDLARFLVRALAHPSSRQGRRGSSSP